MTRMIAALTLLLAAPALAQPASEAVICDFGGAKPGPCTMTDTVRRNGAHAMEFTAGKRKVTFIGRSQSGWWSGTLNGRPAMGYERNRGRIAFMRVDLTQSFEWWYPASEHGTY